MDNLAEYFISDEDEPQPKSRKTKKTPTIKQKLIKKSNFSQVKNINIYEREYQKWIDKFNTKIYDHFKKVFFLVKKFVFF